MNIIKHANTNFEKLEIIINEGIYVCPICGHIEKLEGEASISFGHDTIAKHFDSNKEDKVKEYLNSIQLNYSVPCPNGCECFMFEADNMELAETLSMLIPHINTFMSCAGHIGMCFGIPTDDTITEDEMLKTQDDSISLTGPWIDFDITADSVKSANTALFIDCVEKIIKEAKTRNINIYNNFRINSRKCEGSDIIRISCMDDSNIIEKYPDLLKVLREVFFDTIKQAFMNLNRICPYTACI